MFLDDGRSAIEMEPIGIMASHLGCRTGSSHAKRYDVTVSVFGSSTVQLHGIAVRTQDPQSKRKEMENRELIESNDK